MDITKVTTWIKDNKITTLAIGLAIAGIAVYLSRKAFKPNTRTLGGCTKRKPIKRRQLALEGLK